ncbi:hypothetical protein DB30_06761 [Enhygromyxa salina]|uniref:Uncharacterized protein n=1 Tax=Enhygromyxa salina TaxID=215803 RepID=A0A0C1ZTN8_9BACT|nr:hypothetical protein [Enhygromyxa salina]KIG14418.1 hypothetical protein DB30_06761 [Enhygromyxa salina]
MPEAPSQRRDAAGRLHEAGKGELLEELRLNGELELGGGNRSSASLCLTNAGLYLVLLQVSVLQHGRGQPHPDVIDLLGANRRLRYHTRLLGDRLEIDRWMLSVPRGHAEQALRMIGLARIRRAFGRVAGSGPERREQQAAQGRARIDDPDGPWAWSGPFIDEISPIERAWLLRWLDRDERLLVWKFSDERHRFDSRVLGVVEREQALVITERRQSLVAISPVGDPWSAALPDAPLEIISSTVGRSVARSGGHQLRLSLGDGRSFEELALLPGRRGVARLRGLARALWRHGRGGGAIDRASAILDELAPNDPFARLTRALLIDPRDRDAEASGPGQARPDPDSSSLAALVAPLEPTSARASVKVGGLPDPVFEALRELVEHAQGDAAGIGAALVEWWRDWELGPELGEVLVEHLCELGRVGLEIGLPLHEELRPLLQAQLDDNPVDAALLDFVLAEHLLALGRAKQALQLLTQRRQQLPSEQLQDLLPPSPARGGQRIRIELHELAAAAHAQLGDDQGVALSELARLQPLVLERVEQLIEDLRARALEDGDPKRSLLIRAKRVRELLDEQGFAPKPALAAGSDPRPDAEASPEGDAGGTLERYRVRSLDAERLELLRHPAARVDGVLGRLQGALAKVAVPDCSVLKSYCERANLARNAALARALTDATVVLGLGSVEVFVSRGDKSVGLRAYEGDTSFLLVGGDHLNPSSDAFLDPAALRFAVAAELAHLRYSHTRVTGDEVWAGTVGLGLQGLGMLIVAAPILKGLKAPAQHLLDKVGAPAITRWRKKLEGRDAHTLASDNSQVIAAHRAMQLSADRAGLVVCGDPRAAIRAMFSVHPAYLTLWPLVGSHGLRTTVTRELRADDERERRRLEDLAVRVAALLSFYLSEDYALLRAAIMPADAPADVS